MTTPKNLIYLIIILLIVGGGAGWFIYNDLAETNQTPKDTPLPNQGGMTDELKEQMPDLEREVIILIEMPKGQGEKTLNDIEAIKNDIRENYDNLQNWLQLGLLYKAIGDYEGARDVWEFISLTNPKNSISFHNLGDLYHLYLKDYEKSEENYLKALENKPNQIFTYQNFYELYRYSYEEKSYLADDILLQGLELNPGNPSLLVLLGRYYEETGNIAEAIKVYEEALKTNPSNAQLQKAIEFLKGEL